MTAQDVGYTNPVHLAPAFAGAGIFGASMICQAPAEDLQLFRRHLLAMHSDLMLEEQLGRRLIELYDTALAGRQAGVRGSRT